MIFCKFRKDVVIHNMLINSPIRFRKHTIYSILAAVVLFLVLAAGQKARANEIIAGLGALEKYKQVSAPFTISIRFGKKSENLTESMTADWRYSMGDTIYWRDEPIYEYFQTLKEKYDTPFGSVLFKTHKGELFKFKSDNCGWHMNVDTTVERFKEAVGEGKTQFDPAWNSGMVYSDENGVGTKYVEVDIDEQKVYLYENGELVFTTDCVTGQPDGFNDTTCGVYQVIYKASPSVLKGEDAAGQKYEQPVGYWICFNGSQGLHDATWRSTFGGTIYQYNGSHGCVNLPEEAAKRIYQEVYTYYPVIVYERNWKDLEILKSADIETEEAPETEMINLTETETLAGFPVFTDNSSNG